MQVISTYFSRHKGLLLSVMGLGLFSNALKLAIPLCVGKFYQLALDGGSARSGIFDAVFGNVTSINTFFILFFGILILRFLAQFAEGYATGLLGEDFSHWLRTTLFTKQLNTTFAAFSKKSPGKYLLRYSGDMTSAKQYITIGIVGAISDIAFIIMTIGLFALLNQTLTLVVIISLPIIFLLSKWSQKAMIPAETERNNEKSSLLNFVSERLMAMNTIKVMNRATPETNKFERRSQRVFEAGKTYQIFRAFNQSLYPFLLYTLLAVIMIAVYSVEQDTSQKPDGSTMLIFIMLTIQIIPVFKRILKAGAARQSGKLSMQKCEELLQAPEDSKEGHRLSVRRGDISITNLSIGYAGKHVIEGLNCSFPAKGITQLNGPQGSGKSTLLKALCGLLPLQEGDITIDGESIGDYSVFQLRRKVSMVSAELPLLGKNVYDAISYNRDPDKKEQAMQVLSAIGFCGRHDHEILNMRLEHGGTNLSASQRQLLRIARALITDKKIILLDEPFDGLDDVNSRQVGHYLTQISASHTIILVSAKLPETLFIHHHVNLINKQPNEQVYYSINGN